MDLFNHTIELIFSLALFINAALFIPQSLRIIKERSSEGVSLLTFLGLLIIQFTIVLHALITHDKILFYGYAVSMVTTALVVILALLYRKKGNLESINLTIQDFIDQIPANVYCKSKDGRYLIINKTMLAESESNYDLVKIGKNDFEILSKEDASKIRLNDDEVMRSEKTLSYKEVILNKHGQQKIYLTQKSPLFNKKHESTGIIGVSCDITDYSNEVTDQLYMLENIIAQMPGKIYWMNRDAVYMGCNNNEAEAIGLKSRNDIIGKRNKDLPGFLIPEVLDPVNEKIMSTGESVMLEEPAIRPNGSIATYLSSKVPLKNKNNKVTGLLGISVDITDRKKQEEDLKRAKEKAEEAAVLKNDFIKNIEHDLRTPFTGILGIAEMIWKQETDNEKKEMLGYIVSSAKQLLDYHNYVLEFSKVIAGNFPVLCKKMDIKKLVSNVVAIEMPAALEKKLNFTMEFDDAIPSVLMSDEYRVSRILLNLISNAIKFTIKGSIHLCVKAQVIKEKNIVIDFNIKDTGMGIPLDKQQYIFEQFTRLTPANEGIYSGLGIGLKIVKEFTRDLSGNIDLISNINQGTNFTISLPFEIPLTQQL